MTTPIDQFGNEPFWVIIIKVIAVFAFLVVMTLFAIVFERKVVGRMQNRIGPNRVGPFGSLQSLADGLKLAFKEDIMPVLADKPVYFLAPILSAVPAFLAFSVIPFGPTVSMFGYRTPLQLTDLPVGVLIVFACSSLGVYGIVLSGWSSGSTYPLLGALRSAAQMISYEVAMGLAFVAVFLYAGSMSTSQIVDAQTNVWYIGPLFVSFVVYAIAVVGETNRAPFDLPEAESELVGGFHTEYSSLKFALFFLAEYINMVTVSALATTLFLGGWRAPWPLSLWSGANSGWWPILWFTAKLIIGIFFFVWLRATLPRLRYDQFMRFGWKGLVPVSLVWILVISAFTVLRQQYAWGTRQLLLYFGLPIAVVLAVVALFWPNERAAVIEEEPAGPGGPADEPSFPTPPMDLVVPDSTLASVVVAAGPGAPRPAATAPGPLLAASRPTATRPPAPTGRPAARRGGAARGVGGDTPSEDTPSGDQS